MKKSAFKCRPNLFFAEHNRDPALVHLAVAPGWGSLRGDPPFAERLRSMALPSIADDNIVLNRGFRQIH